MESFAEKEQGSVRFLTVDEFAKQIGVHPQTVRAWDNAGILTAHHKTPGGHRMYALEQVEQYLSGR